MGRVLLPFEYLEPETVDAAIDMASQKAGTYLMGGCTLVPSLRRRQRRDSCLIALNRVVGLDDFSIHPKTGLRIGSKVVASALLSNIWAGKRFAALHEACEQLYPPHIGNMGTIVGNLCSAVPYFDLPTAAMALDAELHIKGPSRERVIALENFYEAKFTTALTPGELVTGLYCPPHKADSGSAFKKIYRSRRTADDLHKINSAAMVTLDAAREKITQARVVVGSWGFRPESFPAAEALLIGHAPNFDLFDAAAQAVLKELRPVTDMGWVEKTRFAQCRVLVRDTIAQAASRAKSRHDPFEDAAEILEDAK